ncbi:hypothetical protein GOALK_016_01300 [Gordonia alkanivorans NBRC 16433]|uniref:Uncharacterized protein n=1 Tax=Gordonia alkanivorans NBRC 16433 TaxID=1027371 RepID=F9VQW8_9ACTN|nr:hypothetical protein GOALK_016_01300 [Gordonia alkanivorans NBRC 16433]
MRNPRDPGESEFSTGRANGRRTTTDPYRPARDAMPGNPGPTVTPLSVEGGHTYRGTIASDTTAEAQARLLPPPTAPLPRKRVRRA